MKTPYAMTGVPATDADILYLLRGQRSIERYREYGLLPMESHPDNGRGCALYLTFPDAARREAFLRHFGDDEPRTESTPERRPLLVERFPQKLAVWWQAQPERIRRIFSVHPSCTESWARFDLTTRLRIYNYCILRENGLPVAEEDFQELISALADAALTVLNDRPTEEMRNPDTAAYRERYQIQFDRIRDNIGAVVAHADFSDLSSVPARYTISARMIDSIGQHTFHNYAQA